MDELIFLDTETTGNELLKDHLFQICYLNRGSIHSQFFKPPVPISVKAQSITHVTNKMVADKESFTDSEFKRALQEELRGGILVAHNAPFDICMLSKEGVEVPRFICTLKVARFLDEMCEIPEFNLQYLRYLWELEVKGFPHDAESDVYVLEAVFKKLYGAILKRTDERGVIPKMMEISSQPFLFRVLNFGKYKGWRVEEVVIENKGYLEWLLSEKMKNEEAEADWIFTLKHHLGKS